MRAPRTNADLEREQHAALCAQRGELWRLAYRGFQMSGRGWIVADGSQKGRAQPMAVRWRSGHDILHARGNIFGWVQQAAGHMRDYDPRREFVVQYVSPAAAVQVFRLAVPRSLLIEKEAAPSATEEASDC